MTNKEKMVKVAKWDMEAQLAAVIQREISKFREKTGLEVSSIDVRFITERGMSGSEPRYFVGGVEARVML